MTGMVLFGIVVVLIFINLDFRITQLSKRISKYEDVNMVVTMDEEQYNKFKSSLEKHE